MKSQLTVLLIFLCSISVHAQLAYSDRGHWIGARAGYVPAGPSKGLAGILMYEYRSHKTLSWQLDMSAIQFPSGLSLILGAGMRLRIPLATVNKNVYALVGFSSGSMYPVLFAAAGAEYGIIERIGLVIQYRSYTSNFDYLRPTYGIYSVGITYDITSTSLRESYLMEKE